MNIVMARCCAAEEILSNLLQSPGDNQLARARSLRTIDEARGGGHQNVMLIYKIFRAEEWAQLQAEGQTLGAPVDLADGYVHFSTATQAAETAAKHFAGVEGLVLLGCETDSMAADLVWEPSRGGALFPHLYRALQMKDVVWSRDLPFVDGAHRLPEEMA